MIIKNNYIKQLDGLRAVAVVLVIIHHWFPKDNLIHIYTALFNGVDIFFVLSGFLITRILINNSIEAEQNITSKGSLIKKFFIRRSLRIFPIYYLTITFIFIFSDASGTDIRNSYPYFFTYTANFYFYNQGDWDGMLSHLWSLSVEEQFYLFWPWLILFLKRRYILPMILVFIFIGLVSQYNMGYLGDIFTTSCFDGLGMGALMAWIVVYKPFLIKKTFSFLSVLAVICVGLQIDRIFGSGFNFLPSRTLTAVCTLWIISWLLLNGNNTNSYFNSFWNQKYLILIGKISYGIYLYHLPVQFYLWEELSLFNSYLPDSIYSFNLYLLLVESSIILFFISYLSWRLIELPILKLKKYFEYQEDNKGVISNVNAGLSLLKKGENEL